MKKIALIKYRSLSYVNDHVIDILRRSFPEYPLEVIDIEELFLKKGRWIILKNIFLTLKEYGYALAVRKRKFGWSFLTTPYFLKTAKKLIRQELERGDYLFSFQTQSFFDASIEGLPHFVYTDHTHLANLRYSYFDKRSLNSDESIALEREIYKNARIIFTFSEFASASLIEDYRCDPKRVHCVYSGVNIMGARPSQHTPENKNILFAGIDWERKGGPELVEAFQKVLKNYPDATLTIVGCRPKINVPNCRVVGRVSKEELARYYENASIFCMPSKVEPGAGVLVEAAFHKLPVVTTNVGGSAERVLDGKTGYLVPPGNIEKLAQVLGELLADPEKRKAFGEAGFNFVQERFSWPKVGERICREIRIVLEQPLDPKMPPHGPDRAIKLKKIAFIKYRSNSNTNEKVFQILSQNFSDHEIEKIDMLIYLSIHAPHAVIFNIFWIIKMYGVRLFFSPKEMERRFLATTFIFKKIKSLMSKYLESGDYQFSFQMQSMFDTSSGKIPHFVYTDHTHLANLYYLNFDEKKLHTKEWIELEKTIYQNATLNFTMSSHISRSIVEQYHVDPKKIMCVYGGSNVPVEFSAPNTKDYRQKHILFVGVDWERKGGPELAEAFKKVLKVHSDARLTIVGASPKLHLPNCEVVGRVLLSQIPRYYKEASVFCVPTKLEPFGIAFIEAMSYGLPIVATDIGAVPDFVGQRQNGILVKPGDTNGLTEALLELLKDPDQCRKLGQEGFRIAKERYSWSEVGERIKENIKAFL